LAEQVYLMPESAKILTVKVKEKALKYKMYIFQVFFVKLQHFCRIQK